LTPSKSGAFSFRPRDPCSTTYQTWITGIAALRQASASRRQFSTTFCSCACCGAPDSAKAPPSPMTSTCMSWMISAARLRSMLIDSCTFSLISPLRS
jgi:hypothetical protein